MAPAFTSINEALFTASIVAPDKGYTFLEKGISTKITYEELYKEALIRAKQLNSLGVEQGASVIVLFEKNIAFAATYFGIIMCGAAPCIVPTIQMSRSLKDSIEKIDKIALLINAKHIIGSQNQVLEFKHLNYIDISTLNFHIDSSFEPTSNDIALIQASSGTTGLPKCIPLTQANVLHNADQSSKRLGVIQNGKDVMVSWVPMFHDMGLIGCFICPLYSQIESVQMTTMQFLRNPESWLQAISDYQGTLSSAPVFAYGLTAKKTSEEVLKKLDLSKWRSAITGAEQIDYRTLFKFGERFSSCGFNVNAFTPCYGLAEAALLVTMHVPGTKLAYEHVDYKALTKNRKAIVNDTETTENTSSIVNCGKAVENTKIKICSDDGKPLTEGTVGEIWISGPSVVSGYIGLNEDNTNNFADGWFKTGDLGYLREEYLFVTGRKKELIIVRGHNYAPTEFEWVASEVSGVAAGKVIAFGVFDESSATESLNIVLERDKKLGREQSNIALAEAVKLHVAKKLGIFANVEVLPKNTITKTTSGKLQRTKISQIYSLKENERQLVR